MHSLQVLSLLLAIATTISALVIPSRSRITGAREPRYLDDGLQTVDNQKWRKLFQAEKIEYKKQNDKTEDHDQRILQLKPEHVAIAIKTDVDEKPTSELNSETYEFSEDEKEDASDWVGFEDGEDFL